MSGNYLKVPDVSLRSPQYTTPDSGYPSSRPPDSSKSGDGSSRQADLSKKTNRTQYQCYVLLDNGKPFEIPRSLAEKYAIVNTPECLMIKIKKASFIKNPTDVTANKQKSNGQQQNSSQSPATKLQPSGYKSQNSSNYQQNVLNKQQNVTGAGADPIEERLLGVEEKLNNSSIHKQSRNELPTAGYVSKEDIIFHKTIPKGAADKEGRSKESGVHVPQGPGFEEWGSPNPQEEGYSVHSPISVESRNY